MKHNDSQVTSGYSCSTVRLITDPARDGSVPVGLFLWNESESKLLHRFPKDGERLEGTTVAHALPYIEAAVEDIASWSKLPVLPFASAPIKPLSIDWWSHVSQLMHHGIKIDPPKVIDVRTPVEEIDSLFDYYVRPIVPRVKRRSRIDGYVSRALGPHLSRTYRRSVPVPGYKGRRITPLRAYRVPGKEVIVEAVNLAGRNAEDDSDQLTSRIRRIRAGASEQPTRLEVSFVIGYLASPEGLNGEEALKSWIEEQGGVTTFNLEKEKDEFRRAAQESLQSNARLVPLKA
jgi:hypothetical protein